MLHFFLELNYECIICCTDCIRLNFHHDLFCSVCEFQSRNSLIYVIGPRIDCCYESCSCVATEWILQKSCNLRLAIGDMFLFLSLRQGRDDFAEWWQTQVDLFKLLEMVTSHSLILMNLLTTSQITQVQFSSEKHATIIGCVTFDQNLENCMWSTWMNVRPCLSRYSILFSSLQKYEAIVWVLHDIFALTLHKNTSMLILSDI